MKDKYIFLTRNNNDLDHLTAILYKDFINISDKCLIIITSNENLSSNPRIEVLKNLGFNKRLKQACVVKKFGKKVKIQLFVIVRLQMKAELQQGGGW